MCLVAARHSRCLYHYAHFHMHLSKLAAPHMQIEPLGTSEPLGSAKYAEHPEHHAIVAAILRALDEISFGSVEIVIHASKVVQIERRERVRFNEQSRAWPTSGTRSNSTPQSREHRP